MASTSRNEILEQEVPFQAGRIADEIMETVIILELPFKLDQLTKGDGNCFLRAIIKQCKRPEIFSQLRPLVKRLVKDKSGYSMLRSSVQTFVMKSKLPNVGRLKAQYYEYENAGRQNKQKYQGLAEKYPGCIVIQKVSNQYTLRKKSRDVVATATVIQFPIKLAFAITSHKIQGQTISWPMTVVLDIESIFEDAQAHVMLSRVQQLRQIYILKKLDESKSTIALKETERLASMSMNKNPSPWLKDCDNTIKVASLNCAGLKAHIKDIESDDTLLKGDIIHLIETSLEEYEPCPLNFKGNERHIISVGNGKGIATYYKDSGFRNQQDFITHNLQIM